MTKRPEMTGDTRAAVRNLGGQTAIVMAGTAFTFVVGLPFQIYLARSLGTVGLGTVGIAEALVLTAAGFLSFGLAPLAVRYIPEYRLTGNARAIRLLILTGLAVLGCMGTLGAVLMPWLAVSLPSAAGITLEAEALLGVLGLLLPVSMLSFFLAQSLRGFQEIRVVVLSTSVLALVAKVVLTAALFTTLGVSALNYAWAMVLSQTVVVVPLGWALWHLVRAMPAAPAPAAVDWRAWTSFAGTNYASGLTNTLVGNLDRIVIGTLLGPAAVGVLMVVRQLQQFPAVFHQVVLTVVSPVFAQLKVAGNMAALAHQLHLSNDWILRMAAPLILVLAILPDHILALYGPDFAAQGIGLMLVMTLAVTIMLSTGPVGILLNMTGHHVALLRILMLTSAAVFAGYFALIPLFGIAGAGLAVLFGNIFNKGVAIWLVQTRLKISWYDPRFRGWVLPSVASGAALLALRPMLSGIETLGSQAAGLLGATLLTYAVFFGINIATGLHEDDRELIRAVRERIAKIKQKGKP